MPTLAPGFRYVWLVWASAFLVPWTALFAAVPTLRRTMLLASVLTMPLGLTAPLFVLAYPNPPSLFNLAQRTGFDVERVLFCFAIGGLASAGYRILTPAPEHRVAAQVRRSRFYRWHWVALASPLLVFGLLLMLPWNPIYVGIAALIAGADACSLRRPIFGAICSSEERSSLLCTRLTARSEWLCPGYIEAVWNLRDLIAWRLMGLPLEEMLYGVGVGMYRSSVYELVTWQQPRPRVLTGGESKSMTNALPETGSHYRGRNE